VLFIDVDHFKTLNDSFGHAAGDHVLRDVGQVLRGALRRIDTIARWGGEEFVAIVPESNGDTALAMAERLGEAIRGHAFASTGGRRVTCSIGVATFPQDGIARAALLEASDRAMYAAKRAGRDRVCRAGDLDRDAKQRTAV
jgi:diguanylate cyclase (GGDEF)-like protein